MRKSLVVVATLAGLTMTSRAFAAADDGDDVVEHRDPATATAISVGATVGSLALAGAGLALADSRDGGGAGVVMVTLGVSSLVFTPAMGHIYGEHTMLTDGTIVRSVGVGALGLGGLLVLGDAIQGLGCLGSADNGPDNCPAHTRDNTGLYVMGAGAVAIIAGTVLDIATAGSSTTHWNNEHQLSFAPTVLKTPSGTTTAGLGFSGRF